MDRNRRRTHRDGARLRRGAGLALAALLAGAPALAAQHPHGGSGMDGGSPGPHGAGSMPAHMRPGALMAHVPTAILHQSDLLDLSDAQVEEIRAVREAMPTPGEAREEMRAAHEQLRSALGPDGIDVSAYESALRTMTDRMVRRRVEAARSARRALEVLDAGQRSRFLHGMRLMRRMHRMHGGGMDGHGGGHGRDGAPDGGHGGRSGHSHGAGATGAS